MSGNHAPKKHKAEELVRELQSDEADGRWKERLKRVAKPAPAPEQSSPVRTKTGRQKQAGDATENPLPDDPSDNGGEGGGDPGRA